MKISIVTNAFNQARFLASAMESVLSQEWPDVEYMVVDPGSTDETPDVIRAFNAKYPGRIIHIQERDGGPADGLNKAFARATGDLFGYLNADDVYLPGCLRAAVAAAERHPKCAAIYGDGFRADEKGTLGRRVISTRFNPRLFVYGGALVLQQSTFYRADAFRAIGGFNTANRTSWDAELLLQMSLRGMQLVHVHGYWSVFRIHPESITGSQRLHNESRATHARYFRTVMGRDRTTLDEVLRRIVFGYSCLREPRATALRVMDRVATMDLGLPRRSI
jgi:glycosyltransferase involved in cell wall biosynthesis